ncbi:MAG: hypothetical protein AAF664_02670 [Planctomycetota bacterium]
MSNKAPIRAVLPDAEHIEQAYLFELLRERLSQDLPMQELLTDIRHELLTTTKLPLAIEFLATELRHSGLMSPAMQRLTHYFTPFQTYIVSQAEEEVGRFTMDSALAVLHGEAKFRTDERSSAQGMFFYHFEVLSRNRLNYDRGLTAVSEDPVYDVPWKKWLLTLRAQLGLVDLADLIFLASDEYQKRLLSSGEDPSDRGPFLFGVREGRIAFGNRGREPLFLFAAMQRHLGYPAVPRIEKKGDDSDLIPQMARRIERLESRIKLLEEERRGGIDITQFYEKFKEQQ